MVRKTLLFLWCLFLHQILYSQSLDSSLREHVTILSSDSMEGRGLGTKGSLLARDYIVNQFKEVGLKPFDGRFKQSFDFRMSLAQIHAENIVGYLPGNDSILKNEWIVVGAHYDHLGFERDDDTLVVYHGADDNASGVATVIELARYFSNNKTLLKRGIIFVAFDAEESGLKGSDYFVNHLPVPIHQIKAMFSCDMLGMYAKYKGVDLKGIESLVQGLQIAAEVSATVGIHVKSTGYRIEQRTDTSPFGRKGIPSVHVFTGTVSPYHTPEDQSHLLDYQGMALINQLMQQMVEQLSGEPQLLPSEQYLTYLQNEIDKAEPLLRWGTMAFIGEGHHVYHDEFYRANSVLNFGVGVYSHLRLNEHFALQPELIYDYNGSSHPDGTLRRHSITMPVNVQFGTSDSPLEMPRLFIFAGGYFRYHFDASVGDRQISWDQNYERNEWGVNVGFGLEFWRLQAGLCSRVALTPFVRENDVDVSAVNNLVFFGWRF